MFPLNFFSHMYQIISWENTHCRRLQWALYKLFRGLSLSRGTVHIPVLQVAWNPRVTLPRNFVVIRSSTSLQCHQLYQSSGSCTGTLSVGHFLNPPESKDGRSVQYFNFRIVYTKYWTVDCPGRFKSQPSHYSVLQCPSIYPIKLGQLNINT